MYAREYPSSESATVKAFEDAYAKEAFLRRSAGTDNVNKCVNYDNCSEVCTQNSDSTHNISSESKKTPSGLSRLFGNTDGGDLLILLLAVFFLFDNDKENDKIIPVLLAILLLF